MDDQQEELDTDFFENLTENRLWVIPDFAMKCVGTGLIFKLTSQYGYTKSAGGIFVPDNKKFEKKYLMGEVTHVGDQVTRIEIGDIVVANKATCFRLPNGMYAPVQYRTNDDTNCIIAILANLNPAKRTSKWDEAAKRPDFKALEDKYKSKDTTCPDVTKMRDIFLASVGEKAPESVEAQ